MKASKIIVWAIVFALGLSSCSKTSFLGKDKAVQVTINDTTYYFLFRENNEAMVTYPNYPGDNEGGFYRGRLSIPETFEYEDKEYTVVGIGDKAFSDCDDLRGVKIPNSVTFIGVGAFENCEDLMEIDIPDSVIIIEGCAFKDCRSLREIKIPNSVTSIGESAFENCESLKSIEISSSITELPDHVFSGCGFRSFEIPNTITKVNGWAFSYCRKLVSITIPEAVSYIGNKAFYSCRNLVAINVDAGNMHYKSDNGILFNKNGDTLIQFPQGISGDYVIPDGVVIVDEGAFMECDNLVSVCLSNTVATLRTWAFSGCSNLISVSISSSVSSIDEYVFYSCNRLESIEVDPANVRYSSEDGVLFDDQEHELKTCPAAKQGDYIVPTSVTTIGEWSFMNCERLFSVTIPNTVVAIKYDAFSGCSGLRSMVIPASVKNIGDCCLPWELTSLVCLALVPPDNVGGWRLFNGFNEGLREIKVPNSSVASYKSAPGWKEYASIIVGI